MLFVLLQAALATATPLRARDDGATAFASNSGGNLKLSSIDAPVKGDGTPGDSTWKLSIDDSQAGFRQKITGFGAAVTDATVSSFSGLSSDKLDALIKEMMTPDGADFALMRHTIGASDLSGDPVYTYDDNNNNADTDLKNFGIGDRGGAMADLLAKMKAAQSDLKILGSPWSPPGWMKLNGVIDGNTDKNNLNDGFTTHDGDGYSSAFADYFVKYIQAFKDKGVSIDAITLQNEPLNSQAGYPTMYMFAEEQATLVQNFVGPALQKAGLDTKVWAYDHNTDQPDYPQTVLDKAGQFVDTVAWHCYANNVDWKVLSDFKTKNDKVQQYMTECWTPRTGSWNQVADFTLGPLQNWAQGVTAWTLGTGPTLSSGGCGQACTGLVTIKDGDYEFETSYYMLAQFSKGLKPGGTVVSGTGSSKDDQGKGVEAVGAVNPDGSRGVVMVNTFGNDIYVHLNTSDGVWSGNVPSESVTTWVLPKA